MLNRSMGWFAAIALALVLLAWVLPTPYDNAAGAISLLNLALATYHYQRSSPARCREHQHPKES